MGQEQFSVLQNFLTGVVGPGNIAFPSNPFYQLTDVKPYNLNIHVLPLAVTYPSTNNEVAGIVQCAAENDAKVQPRSGGHSYGNFGGFSSLIEPNRRPMCIQKLISWANDCSNWQRNSNTIVVDLKHFQQFSVDENSWIATIGAGQLLGDVTKNLLANGQRAMAHGTCPQVGIGAHATIGGLGPMSRMWGLALNHVQEAPVVLANSSIITASPI